MKTTLFILLLALCGCVSQTATRTTAPPLPWDARETPRAQARVVVAPVAPTEPSWNTVEFMATEGHFVGVQGSVDLLNWSVEWETNRWTFVTNSSSFVEQTEFEVELRTTNNFWRAYAR